jgi:hypothetical protein
VTTIAEIRARLAAMTMDELVAELVAVRAAHARKLAERDREAAA